MERMWYLFTEEDHNLIKSMMETFENPEDFGKVKVPEVISNKVNYQRHFNISHAF